MDADRKLRFGVCPHRGCRVAFGRRWWTQTIWHWWGLPVLVCFAPMFQLGIGPVRLVVCPHDTARCERYTEGMIAT